MNIKNLFVYLVLCLCSDFLQISWHVDDLKHVNKGCSLQCNDDNNDDDCGDDNNDK